MPTAYGCRCFWIDPLGILLETFVEKFQMGCKILIITGEISTGTLVHEQDFLPGDPLVRFPPTQCTQQKNQLVRGVFSPESVYAQHMRFRVSERMCFRF